jgi:hypothetical protein
MFKHHTHRTLPNFRTDATGWLLLAVDMATSYGDLRAIGDISSHNMASKIYGDL